MSGLKERYEKIVSEIVTTRRQLEETRAGAVQMVADGKMSPDTLTLVEDDARLKVLEEARAKIRDELIEEARTADRSDNAKFYQARDEFTRKRAELAATVEKHSAGVRELAAILVAANCDERPCSDAVGDGYEFLHAAGVLGVGGVIDRAGEIWDRAMAKPCEAFHKTRLDAGNGRQWKAMASWLKTQDQILERGD